MEAVEIKMNQQLLAGSGGDSIHADDPQNPGNSMAPGLFDDPAWDALLGE